MQESFDSEGIYYIGDPSFVIDEDLYYDKYVTEYEAGSGKFDLTKNNDCIIVHNTHNGDGIFKDTKGRKYKVESGMIGLIPEKLIKNIDEAKKYGKIFNFPSRGTFRYSSGIFYIHSGNYIIEINTINEDEYDSDNEEHLLEDGKKVTIRNEDDNSSIGDMYSDDEEDDEQDDNKNKNPVFFK